MRMVALLRGINVGGKRKAPMGELRTIAENLGFKNVVTYINSGNLVFDSSIADKEKACDLLEKAIEKKFGFHVDIVVCNSKDWKKLTKSAPFPDAAEERPNWLLIGLSKVPCKPIVSKTLEEKASDKEKIQVSKGAIWVDYGNGVGRSKLTPAWFDKVVGEPVTFRNWKTVLKLEEMLG